MWKSALSLNLFAEASKVSSIHILSSFKVGDHVNQVDGKHFDFKEGELA